MKQTTKLGLGIETGLLLAFSLATPASAGMPDLRPFNNAVEVSDAELAGMQGRFMRNNEIVSFGVEMVTRWQTIDGSLIKEGLSIYVDLSQTAANQFSPVLTIYRLAATSASSQVVPASNSQASVSANGLDNITGVVQNIQIAGEENSIYNNVQIDITGTPPGQTAASEGSPGTFASPGIFVFQSDSGVTSTYTLNGGLIGYEITLPQEQGKVVQRIQSGNGLLQSAQLASSLNRIENQVHLTVGTRMMAGGTMMPDMASTLATIQNLQHLSQPGMY